MNRKINNGRTLSRAERVSRVAGDGGTRRPARAVGGEHVVRAGLVLRRRTRLYNNIRRAQRPS